LHYFEAGSNNLHLLDLKKGESNAAEKIVKLDNFVVPTFHVTMLSQTTGAILIGGGAMDLV
jgi:hypothetical protein